MLLSNPRVLEKVNSTCIPLFLDDDVAKPLLVSQGIFSDRDLRGLPALVKSYLIAPSGRIEEVLDADFPGRETPSADVLLAALETRLQTIDQWPAQVAGAKRAPPTATPSGADDLQLREVLRYSANIGGGMFSLDRFALSQADVEALAPSVKDTVATVPAEVSGKIFIHLRPATESSQDLDDQKAMRRIRDSWMSSRLAKVGGDDVALLDGEANLIANPDDVLLPDATLPVEVQRRSVTYYPEVHFRLVGYVRFEGATRKVKDAAIVVENGRALTRAGLEVRYSAMVVPVTRNSKSR